MQNQCKITSLKWKPLYYICDMIVSIFPQIMTRDFQPNSSCFHHNKNFQILGRNDLVEWVVFQEQLRKHHRFKNNDVSKKGFTIPLQVATLQFSVHTGAGIKSINYSLSDLGCPMIMIRSRIVK